jgi:hypothetical protein
MIQIPGQRIRARKCQAYSGVAEPCQRKSQKPSLLVDASQVTFAFAHSPR